MTAQQDMSPMEQMTQIGQQARLASREMAKASAALKNQALY